MRHGDGWDNHAWQHVEELLDSLVERCRVIRRCALRGLEQGSCCPFVTSTTIGKRYFGDIDGIAGRPGNHANPFCCSNKQEQCIRVQKVAQLVGDTGYFLTQFPRIRLGNQDGFPVDGVGLNVLQQVVIQAALGW